MPEPKLRACVAWLLQFPTRTSIVFMACLGVSVILAIFGCASWLPASHAAEAVTPTKPATEPLTGKQIADFKLLRTDGTQFQLAEQKQQVLVVAFMGVDCPLANLYIPRLVDLAQQFQDKSVAFVLINSNAQDSLPEVRDQATRLKVAFSVLKDSGNVVADQFGAQRTPEVFVLDASRKVRYHGRIDDQYAPQFRRQKAQQRYVADAISALLADKPVEVAETPLEGCRIGKKRTPVANSTVTYYRDVLPILQARCQECHRKGEIGPFALLDFDEVSNWSETIKEVVLEKRMPPWKADPSHDAFTNDARLTPAELQTIVAWVDSGAPAGNAKDAPPPKQFSDGWNIGEPDEIFEMPKAFSVPAQGTVPYVYSVVSDVFTEDWWVQAVECRPGNRAVVHHILALLEVPGKKGETQNGLDRGFFAASAPGASHIIFPEGQAKKLPKGSRIILQVHYTTNGTAQEDRSKIGVMFAKEEPKQEVRTYGIASRKFLIPAGNPDYAATHTMTLPFDVELTTFFPHLHVRGKSFEYIAETSDGKKQVLLNVPQWDFNWQQHFRLKQPVLLKRGSKITINAHWDNSAANPNNLLPLKDVRWGDQTWEEMFIGYVDYVVPLKK